VEEERDLTEGQLVIEEVVAVSRLGEELRAAARGGARAAAGSARDLGRSGFHVGLAPAEELDA
jgi:hypothetical protein